MKILMNAPAVILFCLLPLQAYAAGVKIHELSGEPGYLEPERMIQVAAPQVSIKNNIIEFSCLKTAQKNGVKRFCPLSLHAEAKYTQEIIVLEYGRDILAIIALSGEAQKEGREGDGDEENDAPEWTYLCRISGDTGRLAWKSEFAGYGFSGSLIKDNMMYLADYGTIAKIDLNNGRFLWKHEGLSANGAYTGFNRTKMEGPLIKFMDFDRNKILVDDASGNIVSWDDPKNKRPTNPWIGAAAMAVQGYLLYEMLADKNDAMAWTVLGFNLLGWTDQCFVDLPLIEKEGSMTFIGVGMAAAVLYPLVSLPYAMGAQDDSRAWRSLGGIGVIVGVPLIAGFIAGFVKDAERKEDEAAMLPVVAPGYAGVAISKRF